MTNEQPLAPQIGALQRATKLLAQHGDLLPESTRICVDGSMVRLTIPAEAGSFEQRKDCLHRLAEWLDLRVAGWRTLPPLDPGRPDADLRGRQRYEVGGPDLSVTTPGTEVPR